MTARPWRAAAYWNLGTARIYTGRASAKTRAGLDRFVTAHEAAGETVQTWEVLPVPEVAQLTQVAPSPAG